MTVRHLHPSCRHKAETQTCTDTHGHKHAATNHKPEKIEVFRSSRQFVSGNMKKRDSSQGFVMNVIA